MALRLQPPRTEHSDRLEPEPEAVALITELVVALPEEVHAIVNTREGQRWLDHNPIGLEILAYSDIADPSDPEIP